MGFKGYSYFKLTCVFHKDLHLVLKSSNDIICTQNRKQTAQNGSSVGEQQGDKTWTHTFHGGMPHEQD